VLATSKFEVPGMRLGRGTAVVVLALLGSGSIAAQQHADPMGTVSTRDARVTGGLEVQGDTMRLLTNASITAAPDHPAPVSLQRGGGVLVCSTSEFHLLRSGSSGALVFGLDRGAVQIVTQSHTQDAVLTPDLKLTPVTQGLLDLKIRVTREGDTCVDNSGADAPVLNATDPFSSASYRVLPGQHLMFVKGDLHRVVDHERSSCGCPSVAPPKLATTPGQPASPAQAAANAHPFPQVESEGLAPATEASNEAPAGTASSQVSTTFSYGEGQGPPPMLAAGPATEASGATGSSSATTTTEEPPKEPGIFHAIGRFFHHLFHSKG
jgi:hypothetical protein